MEPRTKLTRPAGIISGEHEVTPVGTAAIIVNPVAGRGLVESRERDLLATLKSAGIDFTLVHTRAEGHATELAREAVREGADTIIAVGGDGTVHEVACGMWDSDAVLGVVPMGSGNDFAGSHGIPIDLEGAIAVLKNGVVRLSDVGHFGQNFFFNTVGLGFGAAVTVYSRRHKRLRGYILYLVTVIQSLFRYRAIPMLIRTPDLTRDDLTFYLTIGIGNREGGGFRIVPDAILDDGLFDICIIHNVSIPTALRVLPRATKGMHTDLPFVTMARTPSLHMQTEEPILLHADGQIYDTDVTELDFSCSPRALRVRMAP